MDRSQYAAGFVHAEESIDLRYFLLQGLPVTLRQTTEDVDRMNEFLLLGRHKRQDNVY
jgi:hypothetical protein